MPKLQDLTGQTFNDLTVIKFYGVTKGEKKRTRWLCKCICGQETIVRSCNLKSSAVKSCGCRTKRLKHAEIHGLRYHPIYGNWQNMKNRCYNKNVTAYIDYGGRGICVCDEWKNDVQAFYDWCMTNGWKHGLQVDRIDNDGPYSPENCRIATSQINTTNKRKYKTNTSGYAGVCPIKGSEKWRASVSYGNQKKYLGNFSTIKQAVQARNEYIAQAGLPHAVQHV